MVKSRGSCASISDSIGNLLFYSAYDPTAMIAGTDPVKAYNYNHQIIQNGDSMKGGGWYHEILILSFPGSASLFYLFYIGVTLDYGLYYAVVDMGANGGLGAIIQKNVQLQSFQMTDCLSSIKHGNGRDWWIVFREYQVSGDNKFYSYLLTPSGISNFTIQSIGSINSTNSGRISFNHSGNRFVYVNLKGLLEMYDFDRCTGVISSPELIFPEQSSNYNRYFWSAEFSPSDSLLYTTEVPLAAQDTSRLIQFDLYAGSIALSADTIWETDYSQQMGQLKLAPDNKIYLTCNYLGGYPYDDTLYNTVNTNLSVISAPNNHGTACDLQPYGFYLGGARTYVGLPNNPNYELPAWGGSICDTLGLPNAVNSEPSTVNRLSKLHVFYHSGWQTAFINAENVKGKNYALHIADISGKEIFSENGSIITPLVGRGYYTKSYRCEQLSSGIYFVVFDTEKERMVGRFVKE